MSFEQWWAECERLQAEADGLRVRLHGVEASAAEDTRRLNLYIVQAGKAEAEVRKLRDVREAARDLLETFDQTEYTYQDAYYNLKKNTEDWERLRAALAAAPEPEEEEEHLKHPTGDYCVYCLSQWPCAEAEGGER